MTFLDLLILLALFMAVVGGYRLGFVARVTSWVGLLAGLLVAVNLLPPIVHGFSASPSQRLGVVVLILLVGALVGQMAGLFAGSRLSAAVPPGRLRAGDRA